MTKFAITPSSASYSFNERPETVGAIMQGGLGAYRQTIKNPAAVVSVEWTLDVGGYNYFKAFYATYTKSGSLPFEIDLAIDGTALEQYTAYFLDDSISTNAVSGTDYAVSASLELKAKPLTASGTPSTPYKLNYTPNQASYSLDTRQETIAIPLEGGTGRHRRDIIDAATIANVSWVLNTTEYADFREFYKLTTAAGTTSFKIDLAINYGTLEEYDARIIPDSLSTSRYADGFFRVQAQLELNAKPRDTDTDLIALVLYPEYGENYTTLFPPSENDIDIIINTDFPSYLNE
jgi:hypothetical protein